MKKFQNQEQELKDASREKEKALIEKATIEESIDMERNKLQTQLAQFNKLVEITPNVKTRGARVLYMYCITMIKYKMKYKKYLYT